MTKELKICVHRSADSIGGNCIEICSKNGSRLLLDAGRPLDLKEDCKTPLPSTLDINSPVAGVLISHAHKDHYGMLESIPDDWAVYCGEISKTLIEFNSAFMDKKLNNNFKLLEKEMQIEDFKITSYLVDHSIIDAYAFLIEVDNKKILYSGDFRSHGLNKDLYTNFMQSLPENIDAFIIEGTNLIDMSNSENKPKSTKKEKELEQEFLEAFNADYNRIFLTCSSQNFDRITSIYNAVEKTGHTLVIDLFTSYVLHLLSQHDSNIPNPVNAKFMRTVVTSKMNNLMYAKTSKDIKDNYIDLLKENRAAFGVETLATKVQKPIIMVRDSLVEAYSSTHNGKTSIIPTNNDLWIWSMWEGYKEDNSTCKTREYLAPCKAKSIHTSGHASKETLLEITKAVNAKKIIPIHGENWAKHTESFNNISIVENGHWQVI